MLVCAAGAALVADLFWMMVAIPAAAVVVTRAVVNREEDYLQQIFGPTYLTYKQQVRRWL